MLRRNPRLGLPFCRLEVVARLVVVTSTYHTARAGKLFERCVEGEVRGVGVDPPTRGGLPTPSDLLREWAGWGHALVVERGC